MKIRFLNGKELPVIVVNATSAYIQGQERQFVELQNTIDRILLSSLQEETDFV